MAASCPAEFSSGRMVGRDVAGLVQFSSTTGWASSDAGRVTSWVYIAA
jgi:hypothetical protein